MARLNSRWLESSCADAIVAHNKHAKIRQNIEFINCEQTIDRQALEALMLAAGPKYFKVGGSGRSQAEMQPGIVAGEETGLTKYSLSLRLSAVMSYDSSSYRTAVGIHAFQLNFNPVGFSRKVVSQQRRWLIE